AKFNKNFLSNAVLHAFPGSPGGSWSAFGASRHGGEGAIQQAPASKRREVETVEMLSGGEMLIRALHDEGVDIIFGYPGGAALHIYDAIFKQDKVDHVLVRHEQGAAHAADGYARATGKPGVVLVTSGPGATNAVTGIATAYMDSIPMVVI